MYHVMSILTNWPWQAGLMLSTATSIKTGCYACQLLHKTWHDAALWSLALALFYVMFSCSTLTFPYGVLSQVWFLIVWTLYLRFFLTLPYAYVYKVWTKYTMRFKSNEHFPWKTSNGQNDTWQTPVTISHTFLIQTTDGQIMKSCHSLNWWFNLVINLRHHVSLKRLHKPGHVQNVFKSALV